MLVRFSFNDIVKIPQFSHLTPFDLLPREMDSEVVPFLWKLGGDVDKGVKVQASKHRVADNKGVVGYSYVLLERQDKEWMNNRNASMSARIESQNDKDLASDMVRMSYQGCGESGFRAMCMANYGKEGTTKKLSDSHSETYEEDLQLMLTLRDIQRNIRGSLHPDEDMFLEDKKFQRQELEEAVLQNRSTCNAVVAQLY